MNMNDKKLAEGFFFERPKAGLPDFIKGRMSIRVDEAVAFLQENKNEKNYVNLDLLLAKNGETLYFQLNSWKPEKKAEAIEYPTETINPEDVPF